MPEVNRDQFHMVPNIKAKPGSQGVLFRARTGNQSEVQQRDPLPAHDTHNGMHPEQHALYQRGRRGYPMNDFVQNPKAGTKVYRGELRGHDLAKELGQRGVGMHWTADPDYMISHRSSSPAQRPVKFEATVTEDAPPLSRGHASFRDKRAPLRGEAEVRYRPGTPLHVERAHVWTGPHGSQPGVFAPGTEHHDPGWVSQEIHAAVPVRNRGGIGYPDVTGFGKQEPSRMHPSTRRMLDERRMGVKQTELFDRFDHDWTWRQDEGEPYKPKS